MTNKIGDRIKSLRLQPGYTQNDLGKLLYVSGQSVSKWENGESIPGMDMIDRICEEFHISPNELLEYKDEKPVSNTQYGGDMILQSSILCFFINVVLYILGTVCVYVFAVNLEWEPINWIIGGSLWTLAVLYAVYTIISNISILRTINGKFKHVSCILSLALATIIFFPMIAIEFF